MTGSISALAVARRKRLWGTICRLEDDELRARVEAPAPGAHVRTIDEWHDLVEGLDAAIRAMRACRRAEAATKTDELAGRLAS